MEFRRVLFRSSSLDPYFTFRVAPARPDYRVTLVKAVDDRGVEAGLHGASEGGLDWGFALEGITNATSLDLTLALHQTRYVEFLVRPRIIATNDAAPR